MKKFLSLLAAFLFLLQPALADVYSLQGGSSGGGGGGLTSPVGIPDGGTGQTSKAPAFDALAPTTTAGDMIYNNGTNNVRLPKGSSLQLMRMNSGATAPEYFTDNSVQTVVGTTTPNNLTVDSTDPKNPILNIGTNVVTKTTGTGFQSVINRPELYPNYRNKINRILSKAVVGGNFVGCEVACLGDSTTASNQDPNTTSAPGATQCDGGYPRRLVEQLNSYGIPAVEGYQSFDQYNSGVADPRLTFGTGWSQQGIGGPDGNGFGIYNNGSSGSFSYTPKKEFDTIRIISEGTAGWATVNVNVDGGTSLGTMNSNANAGNYFVSTFTCPKGMHTVNVVGDGANQFRLDAIETYDSTVPSVRVGNWGSTGSTVTGWNTGNFTGNKACPFLIKAIAADLYIINLTINDAANNTAPSTYQTQMNTLVTNCKNAIGTGLSDCIIGTGIPTSDPTNYARQQILFNLIRNTIAPSNNVAFYDLDARWGGNNAVNSTTYNYYKADGIHGSWLGYFDFAWSLATMLTPQPGTKQFTAPGIATINGSAGTFSWTMPKRDAESKKVVIDMQGYTAAGATVVKFPVPFTTTPATVFDNSSSSPTISTTQISVPAVTTKTAKIILEGFAMFKENVIDLEAFLKEKHLEKRLKKAVGQ